MKPLKIVCPIAGVGTRLQPFTYSKPKAFLKLAGKTIIDHAMEMLKEIFPRGSEILFIVGYKKEMIMHHMQENHSDHFTISFIEQEEKGIVKDVPVFPGLGHAIHLARDSGFLKKGDEHGMFIFLSDRLPIEGFSKIYNAFQSSPHEGIINVSLVDHPEHYGVVSVGKDRVITKVVEKPKDPESNMAVSGIYIFGSDAADAILDDLAEMTSKSIGPEKEYQLTPSIQHIIENGYKLSVYVMENPILDIGRPESFLLGNKHFLENIAQDTPVQGVDHSNILQPTFIGKNVTLTQSIVGPHVSIGDNVEISNSIIDNTVIGDDSSLHRVISSESIIGEDCHLEDIIKNRITVGDRSVISSRKNGNGN